MQHVIIVSYLSIEWHIQQIALLRMHYACMIHMCTCIWLTNVGYRTGL